MGGKRPDQYRIDPAEAGATDYKSRRVPRKEAALDRPGGAVKGRTAKGQPVPSDSPDPASRRARERRIERESRTEKGSAK